MFFGIFTAIGTTLAVFGAIAAVIGAAYVFLLNLNDWIGVIGAGLGFFLIGPVFILSAIVAAWLSGRSAGQPLGGIASFATSGLIYLLAATVLKHAIPEPSVEQRQAFDERSERTRQECLDAGANASALCKEFLRRFPKR